MVGSENQSETNTEAETKMDRDFGKTETETSPKIFGLYQCYGEALRSRKTGEGK